MRKFLTILATVSLLITGMAVTAGPVAAASYGACGDSSTKHYIDGNWQPNVDNIERVKAILSIPQSSRFHMCAPDDNEGSNGSAVLISIEVTTPGAPFTQWVQAGIIRCSNGPSYCTGTPRLISEFHEGTVGGSSTVRDLGPADYSTQYTFYIDLDGGSDKAQVYVNGVQETEWTGVKELAPGADPSVVYFVETLDRGDGLGQNVSGESVNIGVMQYYVNNGDWWYRSADCNYLNPSSQVECRNNGSNGQYFFTNN